ncbi:MAG: fluoride efflux transporter CrcB [Gammaproteobacteria bacterium]|nr:MAG: fluoride efflux transporter CrcB [Gammaproteobacteria bacterium]
MQLLAIAAGGAIGALLRYFASTGVYTLLGRDFPYGTLVVNVVGSLLMGFLYVILLERVSGDVAWRAFLLIGLLGSFTTFSTFSMETIELMENGELNMALVNVLASVVISIGAAWMGVIVGRQI